MSPSVFFGHSSFDCTFIICWSGEVGVDFTIESLEDWGQIFLALKTENIHATYFRF